MTERDQLQAILADDNRLRQLVKAEILADQASYGDARRSPIIVREESQALKEQDILPNEALTVVLSQKGWIRAAKGFDVQGRELAYKTGDGLLAQINARSNQQILFFDSTGKVYTLPGHVLPSARGQGEPLSSKLNPAEGASFCTLVAGEASDWVLLAHDAGYGFAVQLSDLYVKNKNGKACLKLPVGSRMLIPRLLHFTADEQIACVSNIGRLIVFSSQELPKLSRGKGNKLLHITAQKSLLREEFVVDIQVLAPQKTLVVAAGKRHFSLKAADLRAYQDVRGRRGHKLPRGLQNVTELQVNE